MAYGPKSPNAEIPVAIRRWKRLAQRVIVQSIRGTLRRRHVMDQHVGAGKQVAQGIAVRRLVQVQDDTGFIRIEVEEQSALFRICHVARKRTAAAGKVALRRLDLDHLRAEQRKQLAGKGGRDSLAALDHGNSIQRQRRRAVSFLIAW